MSGQINNMNNAGGLLAALLLCDIRELESAAAAVGAVKLETAAFIVLAGVVAAWRHAFRAAALAFKFLSAAAACFLKSIFYGTITRNVGFAA